MPSKNKTIEYVVITDEGEEQKRKLVLRQPRLKDIVQIQKDIMQKFPTLTKPNQPVDSNELAEANVGGLAAIVGVLQVLGESSEDLSSPERWMEMTGDVFSSLAVPVEDMLKPFTSATR